MRLAFALLLTAVSCGSDADHAARRADALLRRDGDSFQRLCQTRLSDGYAITYSRLPRRGADCDDCFVECIHCAVLPVVVVPDSGALWIARESFISGGVDDREPAPQLDSAPPLDSARVVHVAQATAGPMARVHCYIPLPRAGGAFVQMLDRASSARGPTLRGVMILVGERGARAFSTF